MKRKYVLYSGLAVVAAAVSIAMARPKTQQEHEELETVPYVDVQKYMGVWYEIASFPNRFQKGCNCTMADYKFNKEKGYVQVTNSCRKGSPSGDIDVATGKAFFADKETNAKLKVQFFWPFKGKYWIIALADDYSYAMVGHPNREYLWILNRMPAMEEDVYQKLVAIAKEKGFDISYLQRTDQSCFLSGPKK